MKQTNGYISEVNAAVKNKLNFSDEGIFLHKNSAFNSGKEVDMGTIHPHRMKTKISFDKFPYTPVQCH